MANSTIPSFTLQTPTTTPTFTLKTPTTTTSSLPTLPSLPTGTLQSTPGSCATPLNYSLVRNNNFAKILEYYNTLLNEYTRLYTQYSTDINSPNSSDRDNAKNILKPKIDAYNLQIINLSQELINNINKDTDLILSQKNELDTKTQSIDTLLDNIKMLKEKDIDLSITEKSRIDSLNTTKTGAEDIHFNSQIYMGLNILLVLIVIGLIIYLVNSNFTTKYNNTNNIYKNSRINN